MNAVISFMMLMAPINSVYSECILLNLRVDGKLTVI